MPIPSPVTYPPGLTTAGNPTKVSVQDLVLGDVDRNGCRWQLTGFQGWTGSPVSTLQLTQRARAAGATANEPFLTPRHMVLEGIVVAPTPGALNASLDDLNAKVDQNLFTLAVNESGRVRSCQVQRSGDVLTPKLNNLMARYSVQIVAKDPLKYGDLVTATTLLPSSSGGLVYPVTYPITYTGVTNSGVLRVTNAGNTQAPVWLRIDGPIPAGGWTVTNVGKKQSLTFSVSLALAAGEFITVDMSRREVLAQGQSARSGYVTSRGWFTLDPGNNDIAFSAANYSSTAQLTVTTKPAWA